LHPSNQSNHIATADRCTPRACSSGRTHLLAALCAAFLVLGGCAVGRELDTDKPVIGFRVGDEALVKAAEGFGGIVGSLIGGPAGAATGASLAGAVAAAFWQRRAGERKGWDEAVESVAGKPAVAPTVPAGGVPGPAAVHSATT
jgi:hypothetical protein